MFICVHWIFFLRASNKRVILHTIGFELSIDHPYTFLVDQINKLVTGKKVEYKKPAEGVSTVQLNSKMKAELTQYAMNFANDSMQTTVCLQFPPQKIAAAMVFLAAQFLKIQPTKQDWPDILEHGDVESLASISLQVIELMVERKGAHKETFEKIRTEIVKLSDNKTMVTSRGGGPTGGGESPRPPPPPGGAPPPPSGPPPSKRPRTGWHADNI